MSSKDVLAVDLGVQAGGAALAVIHEPGVALLTVRNLNAAIGGTLQGKENERCHPMIESTNTAHRNLHN